MVTSLWCKVESCGLVTCGADEDAAPIAPPSAGRSMALSRSKTLKVLISVVWWLWVESACQGGTSTRNGHREEKREEKDFMPCHGVSWLEILWNILELIIRVPKIRWWHG